MRGGREKEVGTHSFTKVCCSSAQTALENNPAPMSIRKLVMTIRKTLREDFEAKK